MIPSNMQAPVLCQFLLWLHGWYTPWGSKESDTTDRFLLHFVAEEVYMLRKNPSGSTMNELRPKVWINITFFSPDFFPSACLCTVPHTSTEQNNIRKKIQKELVPFTRLLFLCFSFPKGALVRNTPPQIFLTAFRK